MWLAGSGSVTLVGSIGTSYGSLIGDAGVNGYTWTCNSTSAYTMPNIRTRNTR